MYKQPEEALSKAYRRQEVERSTIEMEIDQLVYELYGLTEEEIKIVEGGV